jgi:hypothetical protein
MLEKVMTLTFSFHHQNANQATLKTILDKKSSAEEWRKISLAFG